MLRLVSGGHGGEGARGSERREKARVRVFCSRVWRGFWREVRITGGDTGGEESGGLWEDEGGQSYSHFFEKDGFGGIKIVGKGELM